MRNKWSAVNQNYTSALPPVSVIIVARNEAQNIKACLLSVADNNYPTFEIILIDDHSDDDTVAIARSLGIGNLTVVSLSLGANEQGVRAYKKKAQEYALQYAQYDRLLFTDADCTVGPYWIMSMSSSLAQYDLITGIISLNTDTSLLGFFQKIEMVGTMVATNAGIKSGLFYSANGANLSCTRVLFEQFIADRADGHIASGDDMFFIHWAVNNQFKVNFNNDLNAEVLTAAEISWSGFVNQRVRWAGKSKSYQHRGLLFFFASIWCYQGLLFLTLLIGFFYHEVWLVFVLLFITKVVSDRRTVVGIMQEPSPGLLKFVLLSGLHSLYVLLLPVWTSVQPAYTWKGRRLN